jgi:hypothetical protein
MSSVGGSVGYLFSGFREMLMVAERAGDALIYSKDKEVMEKLGEELANAITDFLSAVDVESLRLVKGIGKHTVVLMIARANSQ